MRIFKLMKSSMLQYFRSFALQMHAQALPYTQLPEMAEHADGQLDRERELGSIPNFIGVEKMI